MSNGCLASRAPLAMSTTLPPRCPLAVAATTDFEYAVKMGFEKYKGDR